MKLVDYERYRPLLKDNHSDSVAPARVIAAVDALLGTDKGQWWLVQTWRDHSPEESKLRACWRVLGLTPTRLLLVSASSDNDAWRWGDDGPDGDAHGGAIDEAWTLPRTAVTELRCPEFELVYNKRQYLYDARPVLVLSGGRLVPVSARPDPTDEDYAAADDLVARVLTEWR